MPAMSPGAALETTDVPLAADAQQRQGGEVVAGEHGDLVAAELQGLAALLQVAGGVLEADDMGNPARRAMVS